MRILSICLPAFVLLSPACVAALDAEINVAVKRIFERRNRIAIKERGDGFEKNTLGIVLRFSGKPIENATRLGKLKLATIQDDRGQTVKASYSIVAPSTRLAKMTRARAFGKQPAPPRNRYDLTVNLAAPARSATKFARLQGEITFRISQTTSVLVPLSKLNGLSGKGLENANLKKLGLTVTVDRFSSKGKNTSLRLKVTGDGAQKFLEARLVDGNGTPLDSAAYSYGTQTITSQASAYKALPADAQLKIVVETSYRDRVVKIDLQDIALP